MGRIDKFSRRGRNKENRQRNSLVVIACEGKNKIEEIYFKNYNSRKCMIRFSKGNNTDPVGIVKDIIKFINNEIGKEENDKYYVVIDTDVNKNSQVQIEEAKNLAKENGVEIINSTPTFELWYILHFGYTTKMYNSSEEVVEKLKEKIPEYTKNMNLYPKIKDNTLKAIKNSKKLEKHQVELGQPLDNENCNPYTAVYKVAEELIERNEKI